MRLTVFPPSSLAFALAVSCAVICFAKTRPATAPVRAAEEPPIISYSGFRLLNAELAADGSRVLLNLDELGSQRTVVRIHDTATGKKLCEWGAMRPSDVLLAEAISRDGSRVIVRESRPPKLPVQVQVIDVGTGRILWQGPSGPGDATFADSNGDVVLVCQLPPEVRGGRRELFAVDLRDGQELWRFRTDAVPGILMLSSNSKLVLASQDGPGPDPQCVLDLSRQKVVSTLDGSTPKRLSDRYAFLGDRNEVVGIVDNVLTRWDVATGKIIDAHNGIEPLGRDGHAAFSPDGRRLYLRHGIKLSVLDSLTGAVVKQVVVAPRAELEAASDSGAAVLRMVPFSTVRIIKLSP